MITTYVHTTYIPVGLQQFDDVRVFEHVADGGLPLEVVEAEAGRGRELGHVHDLHRELLARLAVQAPPHQRERALPCERDREILMLE